MLGEKVYSILDLISLTSSLLYPNQFCGSEYLKQSEVVFLQREFESPFAVMYNPHSQDSWNKRKKYKSEE